MLRVLPSLDREKFNITVFCFAKDGELSNQMKEQGIKVVSPPLFIQDLQKPLLSKAMKFTWAAVKFIILLRKMKIDIVHFFLPTSYKLFTPLSFSRFNLKRVMSRRGLNRSSKKSTLSIYSYERYLHHLMDRISANSNAVAKELINEGAPSELVQIIYNGVKESPIAINQRRDIRSELNIPEDHLLLVIVANLIPYKGHKDLLFACHKIQSKKWHLLIVGGGNQNERSNLENMATYLKISTKVRFLGSRPDVSHILKGCDIGILASHEEGFSNAILEGMSAGLPMIVTDVGGNSEAITHGTTGVIVPPNSPESMAAALNYLIENPNKRIQLGQNAERRVKKYFSIDKCIEGYESLYLDVFRKH
ncbi:hypothetical protein TH19_03480 [Thalassospira profundimaris]|uniref:Glycosyl transferase family 1 domain-containing protein n=1 Tax=Thalassospira profundimaris TaxID=502049 RepID=A0A367WBR6_9PROT|nr:hypothetical protein TH19_03480 [Thalassospira profundimaris]